MPDPKPSPRSSSLLKQPRPERARALLADPETFATTLFVVAFDPYGSECTTWAPETLRRELEQDYHVELPPINLDKLATAVQLVTTDEWFHKPATFIRVCNILSGDSYDPNTFDPADSFEMAWGLTEGLLLSPPEEDEPFSDEVRHYMGEILDREGIVRPPGILRLAIQDQRRQQYPQDLADDPVLFESVWSDQQGRGDDIEQAVRQRLIALADQLEGLQLMHGDTSEIIGKIRANLAKSS